MKIAWHKTGLIIVSALLLQGCATTGSAPENPDPLEPINRKIYAFNDTADKFIVRPIAKGYNTVVPQPVRTGVGNFFDNWTYPVTIANDFLQGKFTQGVEDSVRFLVNSTFGVLGFFDPATKGGLKENQEDFGQTLAHWGFAQGPYVVLPILGPHTARSGLGILANVQVNPVVQMENSSWRAKLVILWFIETRAAFIGPDEVVQEAFDPYVFMRDAYLQNREFLINGTDSDDELFEAEFEDVDF